jgi:hypothetical protein
MTDLKLIDELLILMKPATWDWNMFEDNHSSVVADAIARLREAWRSGEMPEITLSLARYFEGEDAGST